MSVNTLQNFVDICNETLPLGKIQEPFVLAEFCDDHNDCTPDTLVRLYAYDHDWKSQGYPMSYEFSMEVQLNDGSWFDATRTIPYRYLQGLPDAFFVDNPHMTPEQIERERAAYNRERRNEMAREAGMMGGCQAYNDVMGWAIDSGPHEYDPNY
jgi:hypothetical protein